MVAVNSLLYFLLSAGLSANPPEQGYDVQEYDALNGMDISKLCPPREHLDKCNAHCQKNCTNYERPIPCPLICVKGCVCDEGLVRAADGKCVMPSQCPDRVDTCPRGEHYVQCTAHCQPNCTTYGQPIPCPRICVHGCACDEGTVRGPRGKCIKPETCPKRDESRDEEEGQGAFCPPNEVHSRCMAHCQRDCSDALDDTFTCPKICSPGCVCEKGMVRGPGGGCIWPRQCPPPTQQQQAVQDAVEFCPENEEYSNCDAHCEKTCHTDKPFCAKVCISGCRCREGFVRGPNGRCITKQDCRKRMIPAPRVCPEEEHFIPCGGFCQQNCTNVARPFPCLPACYPACVCNPGLIRGPGGRCIRQEECPAEENSESRSADEDSSRPYSGEEDSTRTFSEMLETGTGDAVEFCPENEEYSNCDAHCEKTCQTDKPYCARVCISGCKCKDGFVRGPNGRCITKQDCRKRMVPAPRVCPEDEYLSRCDALCQRNCTNVDRPLPCPRICLPGCICNPGLIRGPDGRCVRKSECPAEEDSSRPYSGEEDSTRTFSEMLETGTGDGASSSSSFCPSNEEYSPCEGRCEWSCLDVRPSCSGLCFSGCRCKEGFVRGPRGNCIRKQDCKRSVRPGRPICPENEEFSVCRGFCQNNCTYTYTMPCPLICLGGCTCREGLIRGPDGKCIPKGQCPAREEEESGRAGGWYPAEEESTGIREEEETPFGLGQFPLPTVLCKRNETFSLCPCTPDCDDGDSPKKCALCIPGCDCKAGYSYGPEGNCIKKEDCPRDKRPDECTALEFYDSCGSSCPDDCSNYHQPERQCARDCKVGCFCVPGRVRGPKGDCVFPYQCTAGSPTH